MRTCSICRETDDCLFGYKNSEPVCEYCFETLEDINGGDYSGLN